MESMRITIKTTRANDDIDKIAPILNDWPQSKKDAFAAHWKSLEKEGCEIADTLFKDGTMYVAFSDDFRRALADFGVAT